MTPSGQATLVRSAHRPSLSEVTTGQGWETTSTLVKTCLVCQQDKTEQRRPAGLLEPLPISSRPWESVSMDFIVGLPKVGGLGNIMVIVDRLSKYAVFMPTPPFLMQRRLPNFSSGGCEVLGTAKGYCERQDARFTGRFWTELFKLMGTDLRFSTSFHPQTDGQTERINALLELYLRHFQPLTPHTVAIPYRGPPAAFRFAKQWKEQVELAKTSLARAAKKMKKWADSKRRHLEFEEGDLVLVRMFHRTRGKRHKGLLRKYEGPFPIEKRIGKVAYRVKLPARLESHPVFHISLLKPYYADQEDQARNKSKRAPTNVTSTLEHEPEEVVAHRVVPPRGAHPGYTEYLVKWKGRGAEETSWEHELKLWQHEELVRQYWFEATGTLPT
ncbi:hypothetical protein GH714_040181 [Hevea brasiliensis]|uniref:Chromo domain-containing protein n=1 Tax=Hevea brasiliensis TaxID=3981 RepID=A0A6A6MUP0_HEVBR|nr:hypothetical protein GH714_040181 [Hevea brasiliensis]